MKMTRRLTSAAAALVLSAAALVAGAGPADATSHYTDITPGFSLWTKEYCEDGTQVSMHRLEFGSSRQGRQYIFRRDHRLCAFVVDHLAGSHEIRLFAKYPGGLYSEDDGYYSNYAGAFAAPKYRCLVTSSSLMIGSKMYRYGGRYHLPGRSC